MFLFLSFYMKRNENYRKSGTCWTPEDCCRLAWRYRRADRDPTGLEPPRLRPKVMRNSGKNGSNCACATNWTRAQSVVTRSHCVHLRRKTCFVSPVSPATSSTTSLRSSSLPTDPFAAASCSTATKPVSRQSSQLALLLLVVVVVVVWPTFHSFLSFFFTCPSRRWQQRIRVRGISKQRLRSAGPLAARRENVRGAGISLRLARLFHRHAGRSPL